VRSYPVLRELCSFSTGFVTGHCSSHAKLISQYYCCPNTFSHFTELRHGTEYGNKKLIVTGRAKKKIFCTFCEIRSLNTLITRSLFF